MASHATPGMPKGKAGAASPKMVEEHEVEPSDTGAEEKKLPLHEDIMQLARLGEIGPIKTLFDDGKYDAKYKDEENITPLHVSTYHGTSNGHFIDIFHSGQPSTTTTPCASSSFSPAPTSMQ